MGKVRSFLSVLGCPKSNRCRGHRNSKRSSKCLSTDEADNIGLNYGNNFSFSDQADVIGFPVKKDEFETTNHNINSDYEDSLYNQKEVSIIALCNTLNLKLRHNLILAFVCLQKQTIRTHLCRHFIKRTVFIITKNVENSARQAILALKHHRALSNPSSCLSNAACTTEAILNNLINRCALAAFKVFKYEERLEGIATSFCPGRQVSAEDKLDIHRGASRRSASSKECLTDGSRYSHQGYVSQPRSYTTDPRYFHSQKSTEGITDTQHKHSGTPVEDSVIAESAEAIFKRAIKSLQHVEPKSPVETQKILNEQSVKSSSKTYDNEPSTTESKRLSNSIYQNAINKVNVMTPSLLTSKTNIIWDLDFFTSEPYVNYAKKAITYAPRGHHDAHL